MIILVARMVLSLLTNALALLIADALLDGFSLDLSSLIGITIFFSLVNELLGPWITKVAITNIPALRGGIALVTIFVGLILTKLVTNGIQFDNLTSWFLAVVIIWGMSVLGSIILPLFIFKNTLKKAKENRR